MSDSIWGAPGETGGAPAPTATGSSIWGPTEGTGPVADEGEEDDRVGIEDHSPWGIFSNAWSDIKDIGTGLWKLGGSAVHDISTGLGDIADFDPGEGEYVLDDMANAIFGTGQFAQQGSVLLNDYQDRYGSAAGFGNGLYEHPLSFIGDALTLVTAGGYGAAKGAELAGRAGLLGAEAGSAVGEAASVLSRIGHPLGTAAEAFGRTGAGTALAARTAETGSTVGNVAALVRAVQGTTRRIYNPVSGRVELVAASYNPARRILYQDRFLARTSKSTAYLEAKANRYAELAQKGGPQAVRYAEKEQHYREALEGALRSDASRAYVGTLGDAYAAGKARRFVDFTIGLASGKSQGVVDDVAKTIEEHLGDVNHQVAPDEDIVNATLGLDNGMTDDGIVAPGSFDPREGTTAGYRRAEQFSEDGPAAIDTGEHGRFTEGETPDEPTLPAPGTAHRAAFEAALARAKTNVVDRASRMRAAFGKEATVTAGPIKTEEAIRTSASLRGGTWRDVSDIERYRIAADDAWDPVKAQALIDQAAETLGGTVERVENHVNNPLPDGSRGITVVMRVDGAPVELQILTHQASRVVEATKNLRGLMNKMGILAREGIGADALRLRKAERMSQQLWEGVTDQLRTTKGGPAAADMRVRLNDMRVDLFAKTTDPALGRGLDINSAFDNAYKALRYQHGAAMDPELGKLVGGPSPLELDDTLAQAGQMAPIYYPMMDADLLPRRGNMMVKGPRSAARGLGDRNLLENTGELLTAHRYSTDYRSVWRIRAAQAARQQEHLDVLYDTVKQYGHVIHNANDLADGEVLFAPGLVKYLSKQENSIMDHLASDASGKGLGDILKSLSGEGAQNLVDLYNSAGDTPMFAVPAAVAKRLEKHAQLSGKFGEGVDIFFKAPTDFWRTLTLAGRPAWMVNNFFTNTMLLKLQGGRFTDVVRQLDGKYLRKLRKAIPGMSEENQFLARTREAIGEDVLREGVEGGMYSASRSAPRTYSRDTASGKFANLMQRRVTQTRPSRWLAKKADLVQGINSGMEDAFRRASYLTAADKEASRLRIGTMVNSFWSSKRRLEAAFAVGLDESTYRTAIGEVNHYLNDYNALGPLERNIVKPYLVPFYSFYKHAAKTLLTMPFEHPAKARLLAVFGDADEERMRQAGLDPDNLPGWMTGDMLFTGVGEEGDYRFMSGGGLNPFNAVTSSPLNTAHPLWKVLYENRTGRSTFTGKEFTDRNTTPGGFGSENQYRINPRTGEPEAREDVQPGVLEHLLQQIPQYNMLKDAVAGGDTYDTETLLQVFRGEGPVLNAETGEPYKPTSFLEQFAKLFGYSPVNLDANAIAERVLEEKQAALDAWRDRNAVADAGSSDATTTGDSIWGP